jgi:hypothetical protein
MAGNKGNPGIQKPERTSAEEAEMKATETEVKEVIERKTAAKTVEPIYSVREFADNAKQLFGVRRECVVAALKSAGISSCTVSKAKETVNAFMKKEVR